MKDKYGFDTTSATLVEKLSRGEDWERFCKLYAQPIRDKFNAINHRKGVKPLVPAVDEEDALAKIFEKLKKKLEGSYDPKRGKLRAWLAHVINNAVIDYCKDLAENQALLTLDAPDEDGNTFDPPDDKSQRFNDGDVEWVRYLRKTALYLAYARHPWKESTKAAIKAICQEDSKGTAEDAKKDNVKRLTDDELGKSLSMTGANIRKIRERFYAEVRKRFDEFRNDDPEYFADYAKEHDLSFDIMNW